jgi:hypothetical protein
VSELSRLGRQWMEPGCPCFTGTGGQKAGAEEDCMKLPELVACSVLPGYKVALSPPWAAHPERTPGAWQWT